MDEVKPDSSETQDLLRQIEAGDRQAFERLFGRYRAYLLQVVEVRLDPKLRARVDASDVVQETQLEALRRLPDFLARRPMPFRLWLRKTAQERLLVAWRQHVEAGRRSVTRATLFSSSPGKLVVAPRPSSKPLSSSLAPR